MSFHFYIRSKQKSCAVLVESKMSTIAITGATGYIGKNLIRKLERAGSYRIRVLVRKGQGNSLSGTFGTNVEIFEGELGDIDDLQRLLVAGCTVINLVYLRDAGAEQNLEIVNKLLLACEQVGVARVIHCSTAAVSGRVRDDNITESTRCNPVTEYGITKLKIEQAILGVKHRFEKVVLRPTAVFGKGGEPLKKLAGDLLYGSPWKNYFKSCLFNVRRMNLVHIDNVVASLVFLIDSKSKFHAEVLIISDDEYAGNNFAEVERYLMQSLGIKPYSLPRVPVPLFLLDWMLILLGRNNVNPHCNYSSRKLKDMGLVKPMSFAEGLQDYALWYRAESARSAEVDN